MLRALLQEGRGAQGQVWPGLDWVLGRNKTHTFRALQGAVGRQIVNRRLWYRVRCARSRSSAGKDAQPASASPKPGRGVETAWAEAGRRELAGAGVAVGLARKSWAQDIPDGKTGWAWGLGEEESGRPPGPSVEDAG